METYPLPPKPTESELTQLQTRIKALEQAEARLKQELEVSQKEAAQSWAFIEKAHDIIYKTDADGYLTYVNPVSENISGYTKEELVGQHYLELIHPDFRDKAARTYGKQFDDKISDTYFEFPMMVKDGREIWVGQHVQLLMKEDRVVGFQAIARDITERKLAEAQLRESELRLSQTIEFLPDATFAIDAQGRVIVWNRAMEDLTGIPAAEMLGRGDYAYAVPFYGTPRPVLIDLTLASDQEIARSYLFFQQRDKWLVSETYIADFQGRGSIWLWNTASKFYGPDGQVRGAIESIRDITEHKLAEEALKSSLSLLSASLESTADGILIVDREGTITRWNQKFAEMWKIPAEVLSASDDEKAIHYILSQLVDPEQFLFKVRELYARPEDSSFDQIGFADGRVFERYSQPQKIEDNVVGRVWSFRDITNRRRAEERVKEQKRLLDAILNSIPAPVFYKDKQGKYLDCNRAFLDRLALSKDQVVGKTVFEVVSPEVAEIFYQTDQDLFREGGAQFYETRLPYADGRIHDVIFHKATFPDKEGVDAGIVGVIIDITERKQMEEALQRSEDKFRLAFLTSPDAINITRLEDSRYVEINQGFIDQTGFTREEVIGRTTLEINIWHDLADRERLAQGLREQGYCDNLEAQFRRKDGSLGTGLLSAKVIILGEVPHVLSITRDISDRKRAEEALRESETRFRDLAELLPEIVFEVNQQGILTFGNQNALKGFGYTPEDFAAGLNVLDAVVPNDQSRARENMRRILEGGDIGPNEYLMRRKDGSVFPSLVYSTVVIRDGKSAGLRGFIVDITESKRAEEEKRKLEERLQRAEKMEALGTLAGGVAHDLNNVLGIIVGYSELLLYDVDASSPLRSGLVNILSGSQRAAAIVQDLLTLARRGISGRQVLNLNKMIIDYQNSPEGKNLCSYHPSVKIKTDLEPDLLNISGSSVHLGKALFNLVSNASEAMPNGGTLTIKTSNQYLDRPIQGYDEVREGDYAVLSVSDTGEGISADDLKRIFEPFYTKKIMGRSGTGLGLAVVWGTVKDHYGYINVQSEEEKGSAFTLYFPVTREEITAEDITVSISEYMGKGEAILIVDDVKGQRDLAATMLRKLNYNVASVSSGEEAVVYLKEHKVDLMVLDMIMDPGMDGLDTYRSVLKLYPKQKAVIVSGFSETERVNAAQALGAGTYVKKPYVLEKLGLAVRKELDRAN